MAFRVWYIVALVLPAMLSSPDTVINIFIQFTSIPKLCKMAIYNWMYPSDHEDYFHSYEEELDEDENDYLVEMIEKELEQLEKKDRNDCRKECFSKYLDNLVNQVRLRPTFSTMGVIEMINSRIDGVVGSAFLHGLYQQLVCPVFKHYNVCLHDCGHNQSVNWFRQSTMPLEEMMCFERYVEFKKLTPCFTKIGLSVTKQCAKCTNILKESQQTEKKQQGKRYDVVCRAYQCHLECQAHILKSLCKERAEPATSFVKDFMRIQHRALEELIEGDTDEAKRLPYTCIALMTDLRK